MASNKTGQKARRADPMRTKNGKERLGPLNIAQLEKLLGNARKKTAPKIQRRINVLKARKGFVEEVVIAEIAELVAEETLQATE
jgi:hypothetical protein